MEITDLGHQLHFDSSELGLQSVLDNLLRLNAIIYYYWKKGFSILMMSLWGKYSPYNSHGSVMILVVCLGGLRNFAEDKYVCQMGTDCQQLFIDH